MILSALHEYYQRLASTPDPDTGLPRVPPFGYSEEKIGWIIRLSKDGKAVDVQSNMSSDKKPHPRLMSVPQPVKRSSNIAANYLWDKTAYALGITANDDNSTAEEKPWISSEATFDAFRSLHTDVLVNTNDAGLQALLTFLKNWQYEQFNQSPFKPEMIDANLAFQLDGEHEYLHDRPAAKTLWTQLNAQNDGVTTAQCLITGQQAPVARLHPSIKGVYGGQSSGVSIVSFNADSYTSFGKDQGDNAPVSQEAAFAYTTALNYLLRRENGQCLSIGDASTVFWAVADDPKQSEAAEHAFFQLMDPSSSLQGKDEAEAKKLKPALERISKGKSLLDEMPGLKASTRFFILGLAPNASRLSIRFWMDTTLGKLAETNRQHWLDMCIEPSPWQEIPSIWWLLKQTAARGKTENISPHLAGEFMRAVLTGSLYPKALLTQLITRFRADGDINGVRIAMIKGILQRDIRLFSNQNEDKLMSLDINNTEPAYLLGRLFATLERAQYLALGDLNASIIDRYYASASTVPFSVFPRLLTGAKHHLSRLRKDKHGAAVNIEKLLGEVINQLPPDFPRHMSIDQQGQFAIAYYQQKQVFFASRTSEEKATEEVAHDSPNSDV